jgi:Fe-S-cluster containining protein
MTDELKDKDAALEAMDKLKEEILADYPRLAPGDKIKFRCHRDLSCFNKCCRDVNIFLTPYDVMRLKNRLGMKSDEFLEKYTMMPVQKDMKTPVVMLRMNDDEEKECPFLAEEGCGVYEDRPWPCRMFPVGEASPKDTETQGQPFYFLIQDEMCKGLGEERELTIVEWLDEQGIAEYNEMGELYKELALHDRLLQGKTLEPKQIEMYYMSLYDQDKFKRFLFDSTVLNRFELEDGLLEKLQESEIERLKFAHRWLKFCLFGERTLKVKGGEVVEEEQIN